MSLCFFAESEPTCRGDHLSKADTTRARDRRLLETQVHFYSHDVAVVFGSETVGVSDRVGSLELS